MKDPAALLYIDKFLIATVDMDSDCVGWYIKLLLHQYDKGDLPNDIEKLAQLCNVRFSEFSRFKQVLEQVLMQKMVLNDKGRLENPFATEVLTKRKDFKEKRVKSGTVGGLIKMFNELKLYKKYDYEKVKVYLYDMTIEQLELLKDKQVLMQMLKQTSELYINVDIDKDNIINKYENKIDFDIVWDLYGKKIGERKKLIDKWNKLTDNEQNLALTHIPKYVLSTPDKKYRKNFETYLNNKSYNDEIIQNNGKNNGLAADRDDDSIFDKPSDYLHSN